MNDEYYMKLALDLSKKGIGHTNPNPYVGAVIVKNNKIIGQGYHEQIGGLHAERNAFASLTESATGATLYVTLEPCCHYGKTPPCTDAIIEHGIKKVVVAAVDPNPLVGGKGIEILKSHGIEVITGVLEKEALDLNRVFFHYIKNKKPYVVMKYAMTADGKIATRTGASKWITNETSRQHVQTLRNQYTAIMTGINTVLLDNPQLTCRLPGGRNPIRIICDTHLRIPLDSNVVKTAQEVQTIVATSSQDLAKIDLLRKQNVNVLSIPSNKNHKIDISALLNVLGSMDIDSILLEGGATLNASFLEEGLVDSLLVYVAPKLFGGTEAKSPIGGQGISLPDEALPFTLYKIEQFDNDVLLSYIRN